VEAEGLMQIWNRILWLAAILLIANFFFLGFYVEELSQIYALNLSSSASFALAILNLFLGIWIIVGLVRKKFRN
jgi:hypothetical protein